jgi:hypothetical protein
VIQHDLQLVYISGLLQCVFSAASLLFAYSRKWRSPGFRKTTLGASYKDLSFFLLIIPCLLRQMGEQLSATHCLAAPSESVHTAPVCERKDVRKANMLVYLLKLLLSSLSRMQPHTIRIREISHIAMSN